MSLSNTQIARLWVELGGDPKAAHKAAAIALAESGGRANATNHNTNGTVDRGLFQVNSIHGAKSTYDLQRNVRAAIAISGNGRNWSPWVTYNTGAYKKYFKGGSTPTAAGGGSVGGGLKATKHTTLGSASTDTNGALVDALLSGGGKVKGSIHQNLLGHALSLVQSGAYTTTTPEKTTVSLHRSKGSTAGGSTNDSAPSEHAGTTAFDGKPVANWVAAELRYARAHGWHGTVTSGYRSDAEQLRIWNSGVRPAAKPKSLGGGGSNHSGTNFPYGAVDVSDAAGLSRILRNKPGGSRLVWAGAKDPVHFSHPHGSGY